MALIKCHECGESVSTEAVACPNCGAPPKQSVVNQPAAATPAALSQDSNRPEETIYSDNRATVTTTRVIFGETTYALRNITSVRLVSTSPKSGCAVIFLILGILGLLASFAVFTENISQGIQVVIIAGIMLMIGIVWLRSLKPTYHVSIATSSGENNALSAPDKAYIENIVKSVNDAIVKYR
jgi:uncharacterized membrane protein YvbJ